MTDALSTASALTIADALVHFALVPAFDADRLRSAVAALEEIGYTETAAIMRRIGEEHAAGSFSVKA